MSTGRSEGALIGIDVGGGGARLQGRWGKARVDLRSVQPVPRRAGRIDTMALAQTLTGLVRAAMLELGQARIAGLCIGSTGFPGLMTDDADLVEGLARPLGLPQLALAGDALTSHVGALGGRAGVVVAAGTGAIALGTDLAQVWNRVDGWGYLAGDEGSGSWIGRQGLMLALRGYDGRPNGSAALLQLAIRRWGDVEQLIGDLYADESPAHRLAAFAPDVAAAARAGDLQARSIWAAAGTALGQAAGAAASGLPGVISWAGSVFSAGDLLIEPFGKEVARTLPTARCEPPVGRSVDGAVLLAARLAADELPAEPSDFLRVISL